MTNENLLQLKDSFKKLNNNPVNSIEQAKSLIAFETSLNKECDKIEAVIKKITNYSEKEIDFIKKVNAFNNSQNEQKELLRKEIESFDKEIIQSVQDKEIKASEYLLESPEELPKPLEEQFFPSGLTYAVYKLLFELIA